MVLKKNVISKLGIFLMLIPVFQPKIFTQYTFTTYIFILLNLCVLFYLFARFYKNRLKISKPCVIWIIYRVWLLLSSILNNNMSGILQWGYLSIMVVNLFLIFDLCKKDRQKQLLECIFKLSTVLLFINLITLLLYPRGIIKSDFYDVTAGDYYFLGIKTQFTTMIFPGLSSIMILYQQDKAKYKKSLIIFSIIALFNIFYKNISTAIVGLIILILLMLFQKITNLKFNSKFCIWMAIIFQILLVFFNIQVLFSSFMTNVLHKDATLSSRTYIWQNAKELLKSEDIPSLMLGNGVVKHNAVVYYSGNYWQPHNQLLVWLYCSGILGTLYILYFFNLLLKRQNNQETSALYNINIIICLTIMLLSVTEVYFDTAICYVPFLITYYMTNYMYRDDKEKKNE